MWRNRNSRKLPVGGQIARTTLESNLAIPTEAEIALLLNDPMIPLPGGSLGVSLHLFTKLVLGGLSITANCQPKTGLQLGKWGTLVIHMMTTKQELK